MSYKHNTPVRRVQPDWMAPLPTPEQRMIVETPRPVAEPAPGSFMRPLDVSAASERAVNAPKAWGSAGHS